MRYLPNDAIKRIESLRLRFLPRHTYRGIVGFLVIAICLAHAIGFLPLGALDQLERSLYDLRLQTSIANTVVIPLQDVMGLNDEHRMNFPGKLEGNWSWRFRWTDLKHADAVRLYNLTQESGRASN